MIACENSIAMLAGSKIICGSLHTGSITYQQSSLLPLKNQQGNQSSRYLSNWLAKTNLSPKFLKV